MSSDIEVKEIIPINIDGGIVINGFPSTGLTSAIATESLINTTQFELGAIIAVSYTHLTLPTKA